MKWGDVLFLAPLSVCLSVCPSRFRVRSISFESLVGYTNNKCQVWWVDVQCHVRPRSVQVQGHNLRLNIVWLYFVSALYFLNPWWVFFFKLFCTNVSYDGTMCSAYVWPRLVQGQGHNLRLNIVWLYSVSALYFLKPLVGFYKLFCTNVSYDGTMCSAYVWPRSVQGKGHSLRFNIVWLYCVPWCD